MSLLVRRRMSAPLPNLAARQHGVAGYQQLIDLGYSEDQIQWMVVTGRLHRRHRGVFAVGHRALSREGCWFAATMAAGEGAALSHVSAAQLWGITRRCAVRAIQVSTPKYRRRLAGIESRSLRPLQLAEQAVTVRDGIPVTTVTRTIIDLAEVMDAEELAFVMHEAVLRYEIDIAELQRVIDEHPRFRGRGVLRDALRMHLEGLTGSRSRLEARVRRYLERSGCPTPRTGWVLRADDGDYELDLAWPELRIFAEVDGDAVHRRATTRRRDVERERAAARCGWTCFRITEAAFNADPAAATAALRVALREAFDGARV